MSSSTASLVDRVVENADSDRVTIADVLDALDNGSYGPVLLVPSLLAASPLGAIPGMSFVTGCLLIVVAAQMLLGLPHPWLPERLVSLSFSADRLRGVSKRFAPVVHAASKLLRERLPAMVSGPAQRIVAIAVILLAALFFPLALLPFFVFLPAATVAVLAMGLTAGDGLVVTLGLVAAACVPLGLVFVWPF